MRYLRTESGNTWRLLRETASVIKCRRSEQQRPYLFYTAFLQEPGLNVLLGYPLLAVIPDPNIRKSWHYLKNHEWLNIIPLGHPWLLVSTPSGLTTRFKHFYISYRKVQSLTLASDKLIKFSSIQGTPGMQASRKRKEKNVKIGWTEMRWGAYLGRGSTSHVLQGQKREAFPFSSRKKRASFPCFMLYPKEPLLTQIPCCHGWVLQATRKIPIYILNLGSLHCPVSTASVWWSGKSSTNI